MYETRKDQTVIPPHIVGALGRFDLDPCEPKKRPWPTAAKHYTIDDLKEIRTYFAKLTKALE